MKLSLGQRISLMGFLPVAGGFAQMITIKSIRKKIIITQKEVEKFKIVDVELDGRQLTQYKIPKGVKNEFEFNFSGHEKKEIKMALEEQIKRKLFTEEFIDIALELGIKPK